MTVPAWTPPPPPSLPLRLKRNAGPLTIVAIVLGGLILAGLLGLLLLGGGMKTVFALVVTSVMAAVSITFCWWLDRWEPEPPRLLVAAFLWGGSFAVVIGSVGELVFAHSFRDDTLLVAVGAPLIEETAKALFLVVLVSLRVGRAEMNSLTDAIIYGWMVGAGFSFLEDVMYISSGRTLQESIATAFLRLFIGGFAHSAFTACVSIGIWIGLNRRSFAAGAGCAIGGWLVGVALHTAHNATAVMGTGLYLVQMLILGIPAVIVLVIAGVLARRSERRRIAEQLPGLVFEGVLTPVEAGWLGTLEGRRQHKQVLSQASPAAAQRLSHFIDAATELCLLRGRMQRGLRGPHAAEHHHELLAIIAAEKQWVDAQLNPYHQGWPPLAAAPVGPQHWGPPAQYHYPGPHQG